VGELHIFILWPSALHVADRIYDDLERRFELVDSVLLHWDDERFDENLVRLYGTTLPKRGQKVGDAAEIPFHVLVVRDPEPVYAPRQRSWGIGPANASTYDAKLRYRGWAGGGYGVHATIDRREAERDLLLLLGRTVRDYESAASLPWTRTPVRESHEDVLGADGWASWAQLYDAVRACLRFVELDRRGARATLLVDDRQRAATLAAGSAAFGRAGPVGCRIAGAHAELTLREPGDGTLDPSWQRALLHHGSPAADTPYLRLYELVAHTPPGSPAAEALVASLPGGLPPGDYRDPVFARAVLEQFMVDNGYDYVTPPPELWRNPALFSRVERVRRAARHRAPRAARIGGAVLLRLSRTPLAR
jgi:hypothetical protein